MRKRIWSVGAISTNPRSVFQISDRYLESSAQSQILSPPSPAVSLQAVTNGSYS